MGSWAKLLEINRMEQNEIANMNGKTALNKSLDKVFKYLYSKMIDA